MLNPQPSVSDIPTYYPDMFYPKVSWYDNLLSLFSANRLKRYTPSGKILDIGCGNGNFLWAAKKYGYEVYGQEVSNHGAQIAGKRIESAIWTDDLLNCRFPDNYFDIITFRHVAEHVENINAYFMEINRILKPNGYLFLEVPNFDCLERKIFNQFWIHIDTPRHLRHFTKDTLKLLLTKHDFTYNFDNSRFAIVFPLGAIHSLKTWFRQNLSNSKSIWVKVFLIITGILLSIIIQFESVIFSDKAVINAVIKKK